MTYRKTRTMSEKERVQMKAWRLRLIKERYRKVVLEPRQEIEMALSSDFDLTLEPDYAEYEHEFVFDM